MQQVNLTRNVARDSTSKPLPSAAKGRVSLPLRLYDSLPSRLLPLASCLLPLLASGCTSSGPRAQLAYFPPPPASPRVVHLTSFNSLRDIVPVRRGFVDILRGRAFSPPVDTPGGVAFAGDRLYVCDTGAGTVHIWNLKTGKATRIGLSSKSSPGGGRGGTALEQWHLSRPVAVAVDDQGTIYVADTTRGEVVAFTADGSFLRRIKPPDRSEYRPVALAVAGLKLYAADVATHQVDVFSTVDGQYLLSFGGPGSDPGRFYFPSGVAADSSGNAFVSDMMNCRVQGFDELHKPTVSIGQPGDRYGDLGKPKHLAIGPDGTVFIADAEFARVHLFDTSGRLLMLLGGSLSSAPRGGRLFGERAPGAVPMPTGVAIAETLPDRLASMVPEGFSARYFLFVTDKISSKRIRLFAVGSARSPG